jgi:chromosome segregation ATPase
LKQKNIDRNDELQKIKKQNGDLKASIEEKEKELVRAQLRVTELEHLRDLNMKIKEDEINERRLLLAKNDELKKEIEAKDQINNMKIQKKLKDKSTGQLKDYSLKWEENQKNQDDYREKILRQTEVIEKIERDKISLNNQLEIVEARLKELSETNDKSESEINDLKKQEDDLSDELSKIKVEVGEERETNRRLKEINKQLQNDQTELKCTIDSLLANVSLSVKVV